MRWLRLIIALLKARFKTKIDALDTISLSFRVWITDIDVSVMNHAALMTVLEAGRIDFMVRTNFFKIAIRNKWFFPSQAISVQFYRPLKLFQKAELFTRISYADEKWIYLEQKITRRGKEIATALVKSTIKSGRETVPVSGIMKFLDIEALPNEKHEMIKFHELENEQMNRQLVDNWKT